jgi:serine/threonine protein phosphatase PrpC
MTHYPFPSPCASGSQFLKGWQIAWAQIDGSRHLINEDRLAHRAVQFPGEASQALFAALADGVGGGARGDVAAQALVEYSVALHPSDYLRAAAIATHLAGADEHVQAALREVTFAPGATTLAAAWLGSDGRGHILRVGDSRLYRLTPECLEPLTQDQTYAHTGEPVPDGYAPDDLANMIGTGHMGEPEIQPIHLAPGSHLLLCSDGLHRGLDDPALHNGFYAALSTHKGQLEPVARALCQAARAAGSEDDISLILIGRSSPPQATGWRRWWPFRTR